LNDRAPSAIIGPVADPSTSDGQRPAAPGESHVGARSILLLLLLVVGLAALSLYGLWAWWPAEARGRGVPAPSKTVHFFGIDRKTSRESLFFVMVAFAGALGAVVHSLRSLVIYIGNRELRWSWIPFYVVRPVLGAALATLLYVVLRAGLFSPSSSSRQASPYGFAAVAALAGLFSDQAIEKLKKVAEELFEKLPAGKDAITLLPVAQTGEATAIQPTTATVVGTVNPRGLETTFHFEYGPTDAYGNATPAVSAGTGHVERPARADLTSLTAGTTYHYRLVATNDAGTSNGQDRQFATPTA
jgi:hypothetical protein